jgi:hypothetical protein
LRTLSWKRAGKFWTRNKLGKLFFAKGFTLTKSWNCGPQQSNYKETGFQIELFEEAVAVWDATSEDEPWLGSKRVGTGGGSRAE